MNKKMLAVWFVVVSTCVVIAVLPYCKVVVPEDMVGVQCGPNGVLDKVLTEGTHYKLINSVQLQHIKFHMTTRGENVCVTLVGRFKDHANLTRKYGGTLGCLTTVNLIVHQTIALGGGAEAIKQALDSLPIELDEIEVHRDNDRRPDVPANQLSV